CSTGAPSACARALGFHDARNGTAVAAKPATPVTVVATNRKCRRPPSICSGSALIHYLREPTLVSARPVSPSRAFVCTSTLSQRSSTLALVQSFNRSRNCALYTYRSARFEAPPGQSTEA